MATLQGKHWQKTISVLPGDLAEEKKSKDEKAMDTTRKSIETARKSSASLDMASKSRKSMDTARSFQVKLIHCCFCSDMFCVIGLTERRHRPLIIDGHLHFAYWQFAHFVIYYTGGGQSTN